MVQLGIEDRVRGPLVAVPGLAHAAGIDEAERRRVERHLRRGRPADDAGGTYLDDLRRVGMAGATHPEVAVEVQQDLRLLLELGAGVQPDDGIAQRRMGAEDPAREPQLVG